jgi:hypothetical protein
MNASTSAIVSDELQILPRPIVEVVVVGLETFVSKLDVQIVIENSGANFSGA